MRGSTPIFRIRGAFLLLHLAALCGSPLSGQAGPRETLRAESLPVVPPLLTIELNSLAGERLGLGELSLRLIPQRLVCGSIAGAGVFRAHVCRCPAKTCAAIFSALAYLPSRWYMPAISEEKVRVYGFSGPTTRRLISRTRLKSVSACTYFSCWYQVVARLFVDARVWMLGTYYAPPDLYAFVEERLGLRVLGS
jgi:hypothetical protein